MNRLAKLALRIHRRKIKVHPPCNAVWTGTMGQWEKLRVEKMLMDDTLYFIIGGPPKQVPERGSVQ